MSQQHNEWYCRDCLHGIALMLCLPYANALKLWYTPSLVRSGVDTGINQDNTGSFYMGCLVCTRQSVERKPFTFAALEREMYGALRDAKSNQV